MTDPSSARRQLEGMVVVDHSTFGPGPYATELLLSLGARVIKIESPTGDPGRGVPGLWQAFNAGKESVVCDLRSAEGKDAVYELLRTADVMVNSWRPGTAERLGMGARQLLELNPALVHCSITGFGSTSDLSDRPGHDLNFLAASGAYARMYHESLEVPRLPLGDIAAGFAAAFRISAAVSAARATGHGSVVDVSIAALLAECARFGAISDASIDGDGAVTPAYGVFRLGDGSRVALGVVTEPHFWSELMGCLGLDRWVALSPGDVGTHASEVRADLTTRLLQMDRAGLESAFEGHRDVPWTFVEEGAIPDFDPPVPVVNSLPPKLGEHGVHVSA